MSRALQLARKGWFTTHPNPRVGCVLVKNERVIGEGYHRKAGEPHAERNALAAARENPITQDTTGATAYVTLEPCCHHGKTPPCSNALIEAGVERVVIAMCDPNPLVAGKGIKQLKEAGLTVETGLLESQAELLNKGFNKRMRAKLPMVRCKLASSVDGRTAMASGESVWISSDQSRRDVQFLRAEASAIVTGVGTILHDDPSLNVRLTAQDLGHDNDLDVRQPLRVILDAYLQTPVDARILNIPGDVLLFCDAEHLEQAEKYTQQNVSVTAVDSVDERLDLKKVMHKLAEMQINEVLLETGATLAGHAVQQGLVDELVIYQAPHLMGHNARALLVLPWLEAMSERIELTRIDERQVGNDRKITFTIL